MSILLTKASATFSQCRWFVCEAVGDKTDLFAGRRVCGAPVSLSTSYCEEHRLRAYERVRAVPRPHFDMRAAGPRLDHEPELTEIFA